MSKHAVRAILEATDERALVSVARERMPQVWRDATVTRYGEFNVDNFAKLVEWFSAYSWATESQVERDGKRVTMRLRHELGRKYSLFLESGVDELIRTQFRAIPVVELSDELITVKFTIP